MRKTITLILLGMLCSVCMSYATVATFSGTNLNAPAGDKTVGAITLSSSGWTYSSGLYAGGGGKTFTLTATNATISQVLITSTTSGRFKSSDITNCTSCSYSAGVYTCTISPAVGTVSCKNSSGGLTITQIDVTYAATVAASDPTITIAAGAQNGNTPLTISSDNASKIYYYWDGTSTAEEKGDAAYTEAPGNSVGTAVENVAGLRYLHAYGYNATGTSDIVTFTFDVTKVKDAAGLAYETTAVTKELSDAAFTNTLTNPHSLTVSYLSSNTSVATVDADGEVTIKATGSTTITASSEEDAIYAAGEASYTLTVVNYLGTILIKVPVEDASHPGTITGSIGGTGVVSLENTKKDGGYKFGSNAYITLTLSGSKVFKTGDIINVHTTKTADQGTLAIYKSDRSTLVLNTGTIGSLGDNKFVLPADVNGIQAISVCRKDAPYNWNGYVDYVEVYRPLPSVTLNASGYATFYSYANFTVSVGAKAYKAALNDGGNALELVELSGVIPANSAVILVGTTATLSYTNDAATANMTNNILEGTAVRTTTASLKTKDNFYAFDKTDSKFKIYNGTNFPANKAFFQTGGLLAPSAIRIEFEENGATDIKSVEEKETAVKFFDGGRILIMKNGVVYDALGRVIR